MTATLILPETDHGPHFTPARTADGKHIIALKRYHRQYGFYVTVLHLERDAHEQTWALVKPAQPAITFRDGTLARPAHAATVLTNGLPLTIAHRVALRLVSRGAI